jgi:hypothetical protein
MFLEILLIVVVVMITCSFTEGFGQPESQKRAPELIRKYQTINDVFKSYADMTSNFNV